MKIRNRGYCNSSFEHRAAPWEAIAYGDGHESSARSYFDHASGDTVGRELSRTGGGPDFSDRGREQPERDRAVELVAPCKLARPDPGRIRVTSNPGIVWTIRHGKRRPWKTSARRSPSRSGTGSSPTRTSPSSRLLAAMAAKAAFSSRVENIWPSRSTDSEPPARLPLDAAVIADRP